ncbi:type II secretion system protein N [Sulfitobacter aestuarii]|uniref:Type II secretion system protein N n=1 Tax=Sulfitobacter aestuarii TaxID=2161676 RepID=A0ABW5TYU0_9RHOB
MSSQDRPGPTPANIARLATSKAPLGSVTLIGIFGSTSAPGALIRTRSGRISRVSLGDRIGGAVVAAIADDTLVLSRRGRNEVLKLPRS